MVRCRANGVVIPLDPSVSTLSLKRPTHTAIQRCRRCCVARCAHPDTPITQEAEQQTAAADVAKQTQCTPLDISRRQLLYSAVSGTLAQGAASVLPAAVPPPAEAFLPSADTSSVSRAFVHPQTGVTAIRDPALYRHDRVKFTAGIRQTSYDSAQHCAFLAGAWQLRGL